VIPLRLVASDYLTREVLDARAHPNTFVRIESRDRDRKLDALFGIKPVNRHLKLRRAIDAERRNAEVPLVRAQADLHDAKRLSEEALEPTH
jgi:hypothetical protein